MKQGWEIKTLGEITNKIGSGATPRGGNENYKTEGISLIRSMNVHDFEFKDRNLAYIDDKQAKELNNVSLEENDVLLNITGASVARCCIIPKEYLPARVNQHVSIIRTKKEIINPVFLNLLLTSKFYKDQLLFTGEQGATRQAITKAQLEIFKIEFPPLPEQQRIVAILDEAFAAIAKAKANAQQNLQNAKELFESYLQGVFENGDWEAKTLNEISENLDSKRVPITKNVRSEGSIPYYGASGIVDYVNDYLFNEDLLCVSEDGANLLARTYPIAFSITGKTWVNNHAHVLRFRNKDSQKFVELYLNSIKLNDFVSGMAQPKLNQTMLNKIPIPFPPLKTQQTIVQKLDALNAETKKLEGIYQQKLNDLEELKKSVLQKAFAGELKTEKELVV